MLLIKLKKLWLKQIDLILEKICGPDNRTMLTDMDAYLKKEIKLGSNDESKLYTWLHKNRPVWVEISDKEALMDYIEHHGPEEFEKIFTYPKRLRRDRIDMLKKKIKNYLCSFISRPPKKILICYPFLEPLSH